MQTPQTSTASLGFWPSWAHHIGDLVFGANDGIITTFAVVSGVSGLEMLLIGSVAAAVAYAVGHLLRQLA